MTNSPSRDTRLPSSAVSATPPSLAVSDTARPYRADAFRLSLPADTWVDRSVYTFSGPTVDGLTHRITITIDEANEAENAADIARNAAEAMTAHFEDCHLLLENPMSLACDHPAHRTIFVRSADTHEKLYQEQIHVLYNDRAYTLTASFTSVSRKQLGRQIEELMLSFHPVAEAPRPARPDSA